jgi:hypothetical protein
MSKLFSLFFALSFVTVSFAAPPPTLNSYQASPFGTTQSSFRDSNLFVPGSNCSLLGGIKVSGFRLVVPNVANRIDDLDDLLENDPDYLELIEIRDDFTDRIISLGVPINDLRQAYANSDDEEIWSLLGLTNADVKELHDRLDKARLNLLDRYPELEDLMEQSSQQSCGFNPNVGNCALDFYFDNFSDITDASAGPVTCRYGQYAATLAVCTLTGPKFYWLCAYAATCSYCSGGWVSRVCF